MRWFLIWIFFIATWVLTMKYWDSLDVALANWLMLMSGALAIGWIGFGIQLLAYGWQIRFTADNWYEGRDRHYERKNRK